MPRLIKPKAERRVSIVPAIHPIAAAMMGALDARLAVEDLAGGSGTVRYGYPDIGTRDKYAGYVYPQQMFLGWNPAKVAAGNVVPTIGGLPGTQAPPGPISPMLQAAMTVTAMASNPGQN